MKRSLFLKGESYTDVMQALNKAETPGGVKRLMWERMKQNGCTHESETLFRKHCQVVGFRLPEDGRKTKPVDPDSTPRSRLGRTAEPPEEDVWPSEPQTQV